MKAIKLILMLGLFVSSANAQMVTDNKRVADVYFQNKEYYAAAAYYKKALSISADSAGFVVPYGFEKKIKEESSLNKRADYEYAVFQLATSLRLYKNFQDAEKWYVIASNFSNPKYELSSYWYAESLRSNFKFEEAIVAFEAFIAKHPVKDEFVNYALKHIESCKFALAEIKYPRLYKLSKLASNINQAGSNYASAIGKQQFYFTSSRPINYNAKNEILTGSTGNAANVTVVKKETPYINAIYATGVNLNQNSSSISRVELVNAKIMEAAAPSMHPNGEMIYFTAWNNKNNEHRGIYMAKKLSTDQWSEPLKLGGEINILGFNSMQPQVTKDGKYLIFSSNRPGGFGKYDLWYAPLRPDGSTGNAVNLGNIINSNGDEEAPYYNPVTKKLMFSANGRIGIGGFDFYQSDGDFKTWSEPKNMGYPFNSPKDDLYYTPIDDLDQEGYISSDRESVCCLELFHVKSDVLNINGKLMDCETLKPIVGAKITLSEQNQQPITTVTDSTGNYNFAINTNRGFRLNATHNLYFAKNITYKMEQLAAVDTLQSELCLDKIPEKPIVLKNILYEFNSAELTEKSKINLEHLYQIMVENENIEIELGAHTDHIGSAEYNLDLSNRRAKACVDYLVSKGIAANRMTSKGYGFSIPIAPNTLAKGKDNPEGRALNRRTEFKVTKK